MKNFINLPGGKLRISGAGELDGVYDKYVVVKGDTLGKIAKEYNTTVDELAKINDIANVNLIEIDQVLAVPEKFVNVAGNTKKNLVAVAGGKYRIVDGGDLDGLYTKYIVEKGDTLSKIAAVYNTTVDLLARANDIENVDLIEIDQKLLVPCAEEEKKEEVKRETVVINTKVVDQ